MFFVELKRGIKNYGFIISVIIIFAITIYDIVDRNLISTATIQDKIKDSVAPYAINVYNNPIYMNYKNITILIFLLPLLSGINSLTFIDDIKSGYIKSALTRMNRTRYFIIKYFSVFCVSFLCIGIGLIFNLYSMFMLFPNIDSSPVFDIYNHAVKFALFKNLFFSHPLVYNLIRILTFSIFAGIFGVIGLTISIFIRNKFIAFVSPFFIMYILRLLCEISSNTPIKIGDITSILTNYSSNIFLVVSWMAILLITSFGIFLGFGVKNDVF